MCSDRGQAYDSRRGFIPPPIVRGLRLIPLSVMMQFRRPALPTKAARASFVDAPTKSHGVPSSSSLRMRISSSSMSSSSALKETAEHNHILDAVLILDFFQIHVRAPEDLPNMRALGVGF